MLYSASDSSMVLGILFQNPSLVTSRKFPICSDDFKPILFHEILFKSIAWLFKNGAEEIDEIILDKFLQNYPSQLEVCMDNNYLDFIATAKQLVNPDNYELHYNIVRKYSLLRDAKDLGIDITSFYDEDKTEESQRENLNLFDIKKMLAKISEKTDKLNMKYDTELCKETMRAGADWENTLLEFESNPVMGAMLQSPYMNTLYRGWQQGHLLLRSGGSGCVDSETEYFNGKEWKSIAQYTPKEKVLQYNADGTAELVKPLRYVKLPCNEMYHFETKYGLNQTLSEEHRVIYLSKNNTLQVKSMKEVYENHIKSVKGFRGKFITGFKYDGKGIDLTDNEIKIMCAVMCDGAFTHSNTTLCRFHIKKQRKKDSLRNLFKESNLQWKEKKSAAEGYTDFYIYAPRREKEFLSYWYNCTQKQLQIVCDNILQWDGCTTQNRKSFSTTLLSTANFIQFAFSACGYRASLKEKNRVGRIRKINNKEYVTNTIDYQVNISSNKTCSLTNEKKNNIEKVVPKDGFKYCFTVPSSMLVLRRKNNIFITGNSGKTTTTIGDLCNVCATKYWDYKEERYVDNPNRDGDGFMIHTEMQQKTEVQPKFISWISGIPYHRILNGNYNKIEKERLIEAGKILYESHIEIFNQPDFTTPKLKDIYRQCFLWGAKYCFFDYIWDNSEFGSEYKQRVSTPIRQDMVLFEIAKVLKSLSEEYDIGTYSGTQLNGKESVNDIIDENCIFGSKQIKTKLDDGGIILPLRPKEMELVDTLLNRKGFGTCKRPTHITHNYKTRFSMYGQGVKVWQYIDLGTGRTEDIFCTNQFNSPLSVERTIINNE